MPHLPFVDPEDAPEPLQQALAGDTPPLGLFRLVGHAPTAYGPWMRYGGTLLNELELDPVLRELAIMEVAHLEGSKYEWAQHEGITLAVGGSEEHIAAIADGDVDGPAFDERQSAVLGFTRAVVKDGAATEEQVYELAALLNPRQVVELLLVIGQYLTVARLVATLGLEPDPPVVPSSLTRDVQGEDAASSG